MGIENLDVPKNEPEKILDREAIGEGEVAKMFEDIDNKALEIIKENPYFHEISNKR